MKSLELFSGAGGLAKGLEMSGFEHLAFIEFNRDACETLRSNFESSKVFEGDIRDYDFSTLEGVDVVAGGPPCQPFSLGGKHQAFDDQRDMFPYAIKAISELKPKAFVFENVKGLLRSTFSEYFDYIVLRLEYPSCTSEGHGNWQSHLNDLRSLSESKSSEPEYIVTYELLNAADYGVPQVRERVIIVGIRSDIDSVWKFPKADFSLERLLWDQYVSGEYWEKFGIEIPLDYDHSPHFLKRIDRIKERYGLFPPSGRPWVTVRDAIGHLPNPISENNISDHMFRDGARSYPGHTGSMFDLPSKTIKAGAHGVPGGENMIRFHDNSIRYFTVHEAKLIQGFPDSFSVHGAWGEAMRQIGNAVPVSIGQQIGENLFRTLSKKLHEKAA